MQERYCIIGAGPAGLAQARAFRKAGVPYDHFERHSGPGGLWDIDNPGTPLYETCHLISSRQLSAFEGVPFPTGTADYPRHDAVLAYLRSFAESEGLADAIVFNREVYRAEPAGEGWAVTLAGGETRFYAGLVVASGMNWTPSLPDLPEGFSGEVRHAVTYRSREELTGRRVLVLGGGNSGFDIACDAADVAERAMISLRRGYHVIPKHVFGQPVDLFAERMPSLPPALRQAVFARLLRFVAGDPKHLGLPHPDHRILESHPIINSVAIQALQGGRLRVRPQITGFEGDQVIFANGRREGIDLILLATGYKMSIPFMDPVHFDWRGDKLDAPFSLFNRHHPNLFTLGFLATAAGVFADFDRMAEIVARTARLGAENPAAAREIWQKAKSWHGNLSGGYHFVDSPRHATYVDPHAFRRGLKAFAKEAGLSS